MKPFFTIITSLLLLLSCAQKNHEAIDRFEVELGYEKANALTDIVKAFEQEILQTFETNSLETAYKKYLEYVRFRSISDSEWLDVQNKRDSVFDICKCGLLEEIWIKPDTVYIEKGFLYEIYIHDNSKDTAMRSSRLISHSESNGNTDSLINYWKNVDVFNYSGSLIRAFKSVSDENEMLAWYYETKFYSGTFSDDITANVFLENDVDFEDYFAKRIIVIETYK